MTSGEVKRRRGEMYRNRCIVYRSDHFYSLVVEADFYGDASIFICCCCVLFVCCCFCCCYCCFFRKLSNVYCRKYLDGDSNVKHCGRPSKRYVQCSSPSWRQEIRSHDNDIIMTSALPVLHTKHTLRNMATEFYFNSAEAQHFLLQNCTRAVWSEFLHGFLWIAKDPNNL